MNSYLSKMVVASTMVAFGIGGTQAAEIKWDLANEYQASSIFGQGDAYFAEQLKKESGGQIVVTLHLGSALGYKSKDHFDAVGDGAIQIADSYTGAWQGFDPIFTMPALPFLASDAKEAYTLYQVAKPYYEEIFAKNNQKLLYASAWPPSGMWGKKPLDGKAALKNLRIRTYDPNGTKTLKAAGAAPIQLSWADVVPQLATGGIDGVLTSAEGGVNAKFWEHLSHFTEINYALPLSMVHMNKDTYDGLSAEMKAAVDKAAAATEKHNWAALADRRSNNYKTMKANGMTVVTGVPSDYLAYLGNSGQGALNDWLAKMGDRGKKIIDEYKKRTGKM
jgi:TRAP-type C4-dicarboxylate transport system substrate-binding protein